ncbi:polar amino acid ABC transporter permease [Rhodoferax koreense]|uniref:Polar amino acid ABC transporter permease n=1 Tax=Rhodoferax koreensis TaxID=1842727 RepID=A0A1P8JWX5_9BURK|nr:amino acid ABC transporter permease [Rhodoferax koreense]APW38262.1 polar amino acid ABC transporter permease [Rhodoferax koreense]
MDRLLENFLNLSVMAQAWPTVLQGFGLTVLVSVLVIVFGLALGLGLAVLRSMKKRVFDLLIVAWVDLFRTLPQLVIIIFLYFGMPYIGLTLSPFVTTVIALGAVLSAFACEIFWSAIQALPRGQWDAAKALGFGPMRMLFKIILPQAWRLAIPMLTNRAISISKGTALGTAVSLPETLGQAQSFMSLVANPSPLTLAAALYLVLFLPLVVASRWIEHASSKGR